MNVYCSKKYGCKENKKKSSKIKRQPKCYDKFFCIICRITFHQITDLAKSLTENNINLKKSCMANLETNFKENLSNYCVQKPKCFINEDKKGWVFIT